MQDSAGRSGFLQSPLCGVPVSVKLIRLHEQTGLGQEIVQHTTLTKAQHIYIYQFYMDYLNIVVSFRRVVAFVLLLSPVPSVNAEVL